MSRRIAFELLMEHVRARKNRPESDSRAVGHGDVFVALPPASGKNRPGSDFAAAAASSGAAVIVCDAADADRLSMNSDLSGVTLCAVPDTRIALGALAAAWYKTEKFRPLLVGVTGTNGKTTSTYLLEALLGAAGHKVGVLGTVNYRWPGTVRPAPLTTPGCLLIHSMLADMQGAGVDVVLMEVSSHALDQERVAGLEFDGALITNLTQDHLDYHVTMENYFQAKAKLFMGPEQGGVPKAGKVKAVNIDDQYGARLWNMIQPLPGAKVAFTLLNHDAVLERGRPTEKNAVQGHSSEGVLTGKLVSMSPAGLHLSLQYRGESWDLHSSLVGEFNAMNLMGVMAVALGLGLKPADMKTLESFYGVPGRLERIPNARGFNAFVDYAHTPDALVNAIEALRGAGFKRIITVFGCGGDRDRTKRPLMGQAVAELADVAVLTSDNPRTEDPRRIMDDVVPGLAMCRELYQYVDRRKATEKAVSLLGKDDALLVAGKGHEDYQILGTEKIHYSDQEVLRELLGE